MTAAVEPRDERVVCESEIRLVRPLSWALGDAGVTVASARTGEPLTWKPWTRSLLEGIERGEQYDALMARAVAALPDQPPRRLHIALRGFLMQLFRHGFLELSYPETPSILAGRFDVLDELGRGAVGIAFRARDRFDPSADIVVKRAWGLFGSVVRVEEKLRAEADLMARLDHPGVVRLLAGIDEGGSFYMVRGFVAGTPLEDYEGSGVADAAERKRITRGVGDILHYLHEQGLILISTRPPNFFVTPPDGRVVLADVGHCTEHRGGVVELPGRHGTPGFTAPEVRKHKQASVRTDVWGLARLHSFLATGLVPRPDEDADALARRMREAGVPEDECEFVRRATADDASERPADVVEALRLLNQ